MLRFVTESRCTFMPHPLDEKDPTPSMRAQGQSYLPKAQRSPTLKMAGSDSRNENRGRFTLIVQRTNPPLINPIPDRDIPGISTRHLKQSDADHFDRARLCEISLHPICCFQSCRRLIPSAASIKIEPASELIYRRLAIQSGASACHAIYRSLESGFVTSHYAMIGTVVTTNQPTLSRIDCFEMAYHLKSLVPNQ